MRTKMLVTGIALLLAGCTTAPSFKNMSEAELQAYNADRPRKQQIFCVEESRTSSRIKKVRCDTIEAWELHNQREQSKLNVLVPNGSPVR